MSTNALLAQMPEVRVLYTDDQRALKGRDARYYPRWKLIVIDSRLRRLKSRCRLAHELGHAVLEHPPECGHDFYDQRIEAEADEFAARLLLDDLDLLAFELATTCGHGHAASNLYVTLDLLEVRLSTLAPWERDWITSEVLRLQEGVGA
jgi:Zn-dependent peptidase ImmA (M78 family)